MNEDTQTTYAVRCFVCGHKMGHTDDPYDTQDICGRCED